MPPPALAPIAVVFVLVGAAATFPIEGGDTNVVASLVVGGLFLLFGSVGALVVLRGGGHPIGWILVGIAVVATVHSFVQNYGKAGLQEGKHLPGDLVAGWLSTWVGFPAIALFILLILLFPTGKLLSPRWKPLATAAIAGVVGMIVTAALMPGPLPAIPSARNPLGVDTLRTPLTILNGLFGLVPVLCVFGAVGSQILRLHRSRGDERQQIKLVAYAIVMLPVLVIVSQVLLPQGQSEDQWLEFVLNVAAGAVIPLALGTAILRYRLYDIDRVINRTLVYGALTAILAWAYVGLVFGLQAVLAPVTAESDLAIAASTLSVAALFRPVRTRVQAFIDRRFYRRKFDIEKTIEAFNARLRDEVDLGQLSSQLVGVVSDTMQPAHVSLWLRTEATR